MTKRTLLIGGSSGFVGQAVVAEAKNAGWEVIELTRGEAGPGQSHWDPSNGEIDRAVLAQADAVICLNGKNLARGMATSRGRQELISSRLFSVRTIAETIAQMPKNQRPKVLLSASAIGFYGDRGEEVLEENAVEGDGFLAELCDAWETAAQSAADAGVRVVNPRFGLIWGEGGGIAEMMLPVYRYRLGAQFGDGQQWQSLIALADVAGAILWCLDHEELSGPVNFTCPDPQRQSQWHELLEEHVGARSPLTAPAWALRALPGGIGEQMLLVSQRVVPTKLLESGYQFRYPTLGSVLASGGRNSAEASDADEETRE